MSTGLFYAYATNLRDDSNWRYLIAFATRDVADRWWRAVSQSIATGTSKFRSIQRISPQFYIHDPDVGNISDTIRDDPRAKEFLGSIFFTLLVDKGDRNLSVCPVIHITERVSGNPFFIQSALRPGQFWYWKQSESRVVLSTTHQTKFTIRVVGQEELRSIIMIAQDDIVISVAGGPPIGVDPNGWLTQTSTEHRFKFSDVLNGFAAGVPVSAERVGGQLQSVIMRSSFGEQWELM